MNVLRSSALRTSRLYPPGNIPGTHICNRLPESTRGLCCGRKDWVNKNSSDPIQNRNCTSAVPQPSAFVCVCVFVCVKFTHCDKVSHFPCSLSPVDAPWRPSRSHTSHSTIIQFLGGRLPSNASHLLLSTPRRYCLILWRRTHHN